MARTSYIATLILVSSIALPGGLRGQGPLRLTIDDAVDRAIRLNEDVLVARTDAAEAAGQVREVRAQSLPEITANMNYTRNVQTPVLFFNTPEGVQQIQIGNDNEYSFGLNLRGPILDFSLGPARTAARLARDAGVAGVEAARTSVALRTRTAYYTVLLDGALLDVQEKALEQARFRLSQVESMYEAGTASQFDLLTAQVEVDNIRPQLIEARNRLELDLNELKRTIGVPLDRPVALVDSFPEPGAGELAQDRAIERALGNRHDLESQRISVGLQRERLTSERRSALPSLEYTATLSRRASSDALNPPERDFSQSTAVGVALEFPLFDGRARSGRIQQAEAAMRRAQFRLQRLERDVRLDVQQAILARRAALQQIQASRSNVRRAERALEIAQVRFENGLSTQIEVNDAELAVTEARSNFARALFQYATARAELQAAMGER